MTGGQEHWQLEGTAAELYQRHLVPAMTDMWAEDLVARAEIRPGARVLDVACGTGVVARRAAERAGPRGHVTAADVNPAMLAVARALPSAGAPIECQEVSALELPFAESAFDDVFCQFGLQFLPDRDAALREMRRVLVPGGRLLLNVFGPIERNPATHALANALDVNIGPDASLAKRTEHALADPDELRAIVTAAGFGDVAVETTTRTVRFRSAEEYVRVQLTATPLAQVVAGVDPARADEVVDALIADVGRALAPYAGTDGLAFPQTVHVVTAR